MEDLLIAAVVVTVENGGPGELSPERRESCSDVIVPVLSEVVERYEAALIIVSRGIIRLEVGEV